MRDHIRATCGITEADTAGTMSEKLRFSLDEIGLDPDEREPFLLRLLGAEEHSDVLAGLSPEAIKARTSETLIQMALSGSRRRPLVLVYEDLHWVDTLTEETLTSLAHNLPGAAILLLCTYRPGYRASWLDLSYARQIPLPPLTASESADVVRGVLGDDEPPSGSPRWSSRGPRATRSSPRSCAGASRPPGPGRGERRPGQRPRRAGGPHRRPARGDPQGAADRLGDRPRVLAPAAAAALRRGRRARSPRGRAKRLEFIFERAGPDGPQYVFAHALTHEVAYQGLLVSRRRALHEAIGQMLERQYADRLDEVVDRLAGHYCGPSGATRRWGT